MLYNVYFVFTNNNLFHNESFFYKTILGLRAYTFFGRYALSFAVRRPGTCACGILIYQTGWTWHLVGDTLDAIDELVANSLVPMPVVTIGPRTSLGRFWFLCVVKISN